MDVPKVPPRQAVDRLAAVLDSPEVARLIQGIEYMRWTGRPGYPVKAMVGMCLVKSMYVLSTWSRTVRLVAEHDGLQRALGTVPSQWACYRFARMLRERDLPWLETCLQDVLAALKEQHPELGREVAIDGSALPAYANGHAKDNPHTKRKCGDTDASWGYRTAVGHRHSGVFFGYKVHAAVDVATDLPLAWTVATGKDSEHRFALGLIDKTRAHGFDVNVAIMDKGYDGEPIHQFAMNRDVAPVIPLKDTGRVLKGDAQPPHCAHGEWTFAGADYKRKATKWRCPTGECTAKSMWVKADRLHPLIPRNSKRYTDLYRKRGAVEREFGRLKHEWALLPLRVRGLDRVRLHTDLTILAKLVSRLASERATAIAA